MAPAMLAIPDPFSMSKSIKGTTKKKRGRPATTGKSTQLSMRWQDPMLIAIDSWREQHDVATRSEAIRRLVELGLEVKTPIARTIIAATRSRSALTNCPIMSSFPI